MKQPRLIPLLPRWTMLIALLVFWTAACQPPPGGIRLVFTPEEQSILNMNQVETRVQRMELESAIPEEWRAGGEPHYELNIRTELEVASICEITHDGERTQVDRRRVDYRTSVTKLDDGEVIAERTFEGTDPPPCDSVDVASKAFSRTLLHEVSGESAPAEVIRAWLEQALPAVIALPPRGAQAEQHRAGTRPIGEKSLYTLGDEWAVTGNQQPRYLVHAAAYEYVMGVCSIGIPFSDTTFSYIFLTRGHVQLTLIDLRTGETVSQAIFAGTGPERCPEEVERTLSEVTRNSTLEGSEMPNNDELEQWLDEQLEQLPDASPGN